MIKYILTILILSLPLFSDENISKELKINTIKKDIRLIDKQLSYDNNIWLKSYSNFKLYLNINKQLKTVILNIKNNKDNLILLNSKDVLEKQLKLFGNINSPFGKLVNPANFEKVEIVTNPFRILTSLSHINQNIEHKKNYKKKISDIQYILDNLKIKETFLNQLIVLGELLYIDQSKNIREDIKIFQENLEIVETTLEIYQQRIDEVNLEIKSEIFNHGKTIFYIMSIFIFIIGISFLLKYLTGKYLENNQRVYMSNKAINFITYSIIILLITFTYIDNIDNLITILGFASAGLAIAMKDGFMSIFAWFVIIFGGSVKVGDRIKVTMNGAEYVGDILDISILRITLHEDVTLTTYDINRRAGRVIFVPNNYVFTNLILNYSHYTLKTVWDGIDIVITFDSNHKKASHIMREIAKKYASGYTDMTRKQLNKLRDRYNLKNANVEPRIFSFIDTYGIKLSVWHLTNAYATLTLRSNISAKIIDAFNQEDDIIIAYPTQHIQMKNMNT